MTLLTRHHLIGTPLQPENTPKRDVERGTGILEKARLLINRPSSDVDVPDFDTPRTQPLSIPFLNQVTLQSVSRSNWQYQAIRDRHYVANHGTIGRQLHYLVRLDDVVVGIITGASAVWAVKGRDDFFGITAENREEIAGRYIVNNTVFRLEVQRHNLGTQVLKLWRNQVVRDWHERYGDPVLGFETFIFGENRTGAMYKADNWTPVGETQGNTKFHANGAYDGTERLAVDKKLIFVKHAKKQRTPEYKLTDLPLFQNL